MDESIHKKLLRYQKDEITGYEIYIRVAELEKDAKNQSILKRIANEEKHHYEVLAQYTKAKLEPNRLKVWFYIMSIRVLGITFGIRLLERYEVKVSKMYQQHGMYYPEIAEIAKEEDIHEEQLISMLDEKGLKFIGAIVLGMNDALVELSGSLAGFTLALQNSVMIALLGSITGIAAALSMAASEYLSVKSEKGTRTALKASIYTGISYIITVLILILPFVICKNAFIALLSTLIVAIIIIALFNFYYSVVTGESFKKRFAEMLIISFSVVAISFGIGHLLKSFIRMDA